MAVSDIVVFLGPSLPLEEARNILPACYLGPARCGDVLRVRRLRPRVIAIIDGLFGATPAVWHKEILVALEDGIDVCGASSMGALRAAELEPFGMAGVGRIFEAYRDGTYTDDDEVAVLHAPGSFGYRPLSDPMVNVRATVARAVGEGIITPGSGECLVRCAKAAFYQERSLAAAIDAAGWGNRGDGEAARFRSFLARGGYVDQKRLDAIELLEALAARRPGPPGPRAPSASLERTSFVLKLDRDVMCGPFEAPDPRLPRAERVAVEARTLTRLYPRLLRLAKLMSAVHALGDADARPATASEVERVYRGGDLGLAPTARSARWQNAHDLDTQEAADFAARLAVIQRAIDEYRRRHGRAVAGRRHAAFLLSVLRLEGVYGRHRPGGCGGRRQSEVVRHATRAVGIDIPLYRRIATLWAVADDVLERSAVGATNAQAQADRFRQARGLERREATLEWCRANDLDHDGLVELVGREMRLDFLLNKSSVYAFGLLQGSGPAPWFLDALRLTGLYARLRKAVVKHEAERGQLAAT